MIIWNLLDHPIVSMGLKPLELEDWIEPEDDSSPTLDLKRKIVLDDRDSCCIGLDSCLDDQQEALDTFASLGGLANTGSSSSPLEVFADQVLEDLMIISDGILTCGVVCFPSGWRLQDKIGQNVRDIHDPVPDYSKIAASVDSVMGKLRRPMWRCNWGIRGSRSWTKQRPVEDVKDAWMFIEKACLIPLSKSILFTTRIKMISMADVSQEDRELMAFRLEEDSGTLAYKNFSKSMLDSLKLTK